jgi:hypothetical protein
MTWHIGASGRLELTGTLYAITWDGWGSFSVKWNGRGVGAAETLEGAKSHAAWHAKELMAMGLDPTDATPGQ